jgi:hypothetical protein
MFQEVNVAIKGNTIITGAAAAAHAKEVHTYTTQTFPYVNSQDGEHFTTPTLKH